MIALNITITRNTATPALERLRKALEKPNVLTVVAQSVYGEMKRNFYELDAQRPNRLGGSRSHYYATAAANTDWRFDGDGVVVFAKQVGLRMKYFGGAIDHGKGASCLSGNPTKYLTIPATAESYGRRACDFPDLKVLYGSNGPFALARVTKQVFGHQRSSATTFPRTNRANGTEILFWLKSSVDISPDPTVLPPPEVLKAAIKSDWNAYINEAWRSTL